MAFISASFDIDADEPQDLVFSSHASSLVSDRSTRKVREGTPYVQTMWQSTAQVEETFMGICPDGSIRPAAWQARHPSSADDAGRDPIIQAGQTSLSGSYAILGNRATSERRLLASRDIPSSREAAIKFCLDPVPSCLGASASEKSNSIRSAVRSTDDEVGGQNRDSIRDQFSNNNNIKYILVTVIIKIIIIIN